MTPPIAAKDKALSVARFRHFSFVFGYVLRYKWVFAIGLLFLFFSTATTLVFPYFGSMLADAAQGKAPLSITQIGYALLIVLILQGFLSYMRIYLFAIVTEKSLADLRKDLYARLICLPLPFFEQRRVGELTSRITSDIAQLQSAISINLAELLRQIATLIAGIGIIAYTSLKLTALMLCTVPVAVVAAVFLGKRIRQLSKDSQDKLAETNVVVEETLQSVQTVKAFGNEHYETRRYSLLTDDTVRLALRAASFRGAFVSFLISAVFGGIMLVLWYGAGLVQAGEMTIGELLRFILYTFFIGGAIAGMGDLYGNLLKSLGASERITEIMGEKPEIVPSSKGSVQRFNGDILYNEVHFSYPTRSDLPVLRGISMHIPQGAKVALVGQSGAGKSTIVQLLLRFYEPESGAIEAGGVDISKLNLSEWRQNIGIVPQEVLLFGGSIEENILYGKPTASSAEVEEAARRANALEFIRSFPQGMATLVGERGIKLSGGQRQRIAIARAILKDPAILILDEATSSLDAESEHLVQEALNELMKKRTTIIIAHRLSTIRNADCIYVLENGKIIEQGTHEQLVVQPKGIYQNLLKLQVNNSME